MKPRIFLVLAGLVLSGCDNNPHPPPLHQTRTDGAAWRASYRALGDDPRTLDPQVSYDTLGHAIISLLYECPLQYHPFKADPYELMPCLLAEMPVRSRNPDGAETYLCRVKPKLFFHDDACFGSEGGRGREIVAGDFAYAFQRIADPKVECPVLSTLQDYVLGLKDAYTEAKKTGRYDYAKPLAGVEVLDRHTFRLRLSKAYPQILYWLAMPFCAPVPREAVEYYDGKKHDGETRDQFKFHPVGTGAFRLAEWGRNRLIRLTRHARYAATAFPSDGWPASQEARFRPLAGKPLPFLDELQFPIIRESIPRWRLFCQGYLDASGVNKDVFNTVLTASRELSPRFRERGVALHKDSDPSTFYLIFNMEDPVLGKNRKLRQAISLAFDQELENAIFSNGIALDAQQLLPPGVFGHQSDFCNPYKRHDVARAKALLARAGYPDGRDAGTGEALTLTLDVTADDPESRQHAEFLKNQIEQIGLRVKVIENIWARQQEKVDAGHFQIVGYGWHADYPDPENFFFLFYGRNIPPQGSNAARYANAEFDRIFERMSTMDNLPERLDLIRQLNAILTEDCPCVFQSHPVSFVLNQPWAPRVSSNPLMAGGAKYLQVDVESRARTLAEWNRPILWPLWTAGGTAATVLIFGIYWSRRHYV